jgi:hypothetical protein
VATLRIFILCNKAHRDNAGLQKAIITIPDVFAVEYYALCLAGIVNLENISENCLSVTYYQTTDSVYQSPKFYCHKYQILPGNVIILRNVCEIKIH